MSRKSLTCMNVLSRTAANVLRLSTDQKVRASLSSSESRASPAAAMRSRRKRMHDMQAVGGARKLNTFGGEK
jgi:hypothetical protein